MPDDTEVLLVSPTAPAAAASKKRKITPSPESAQSHKLTILSPRRLLPGGPTLQVDSSSPFYSSRRLFPTGQGDVGECCHSLGRLGSALTDFSSAERRATLRAPHGHPEPPPWRVKSHVPPSRQVLLPFDLQTDPHQFRIAANRELLWEVFPNTVRLGFERKILMYQLLSLPPHPWPQRIAGVPCYLTTMPGDLGPLPPIDRPGGSRIRLDHDHDLGDDRTRARQVFDLIKSFFTEIRTSITELQYWDRVVVIVLEHDGVDLSTVPKSVSRLPCYYVFESEMHRPRNLAAFRSLDPSSDGPDSGSYEVLRPGVMLGSGRVEDGKMLTSSGVLVRDRMGNKYMTVASHGFPEGSRVYHPHGGGREVGEPIMEITHTDVALVKLTTEAFVNEVFQNTIIPGPPVRLEEFVRSGDITTGENVFLDSPFTGYVEGIVGPIGELRIPGDDPHEPKQRWIKCRMDYFGQDSRQQLPDGVCGSAIWNKNGQVAGFFRYAPKDGHFLDYAYSLAADELMDRGYSVV